MRKTLLILSLVACNLLQAKPLAITLENDPSTVHLNYRAIAIKNRSSTVQNLSQLGININTPDIVTCAPGNNCLPEYHNTCNATLILAPNQACRLWFHALPKTTLSNQQTHFINITLSNIYNNGSTLEKKFIVHTGEDLFVGGNFTTPAENIARWDGQEWHSLNQGLIGGPVTNLVEYQGDLIAAGEFFQAGIESVNFIARWNGEQWESLGSGIGDPGPSALAVEKQALYVGGGFDTAGDQEAHYLARWQDMTWAGIETLEMDAPINVLLMHHNQFSGEPHDQLYAAGEFSTPAKHIAALQAGQWQPLGAGLNDSVRTLIDDDGSLYAGGSFTQSGDKLMAHIAQWDGKSWQALQQGLNDNVYSLANAHHILYAGGAFTQAGDKAINFIAAWDGKVWQALAGGVTYEKAPQFTRVYAITTLNNHVYVGGYFTAAHDAQQDIPAQALAQWDIQQHRWGSIGKGIQGNVRSLLILSQLEIKEE